MSAYTLLSNSFSIDREIQNHPAWLGKVSGLKAEKMLRGLQIPYVYVLREGETETGNEMNYYVSFTMPNGTIKHQPFTITITEEGWYYENSSGGGPYTDAGIDDVLHLIMHCHKNDCTPLTVFEKK